MDVEVRLRQKLKDNLYGGFHLLEKARNEFQDLVDADVLSLSSFEADLLSACMHRIEFAFQTLLEIVVDCADAGMALDTLRAMETHPDGFVSALTALCDI